MENRELYTFICSYNEGIFISQIESDSVSDSIRKWVNNLDFKYFESHKDDCNEFINDILEENPVEIEKTKNVWCITASLNEKLMIINIVLTKKENNKKRVTRNKPDFEG